ncbi:uncharacterized protein TM35_000451030 [Trypanosoma theileri]|uniref:Uncharacterized protein n=1 Tax=Trypanosoma theileri TaxID=67003 RepID=A0A1X0NI06_9TRYP|nr:uncharacterized protein TM35_000451030 [Trypanosoma theileri]ORC84365.1 hypothetical protein TM35_000451030 [Trypanosoma theileri]
MAAAESLAVNEADSTCKDGEDSGSCAARPSAASGHAANSCEDGSSGCAAAGGAARPVGEPGRPASAPGGVEASGVLAGQPSGGVGDCPPGKNGTPCTPGVSEPDPARKDCVNPPSGADSCPTNVDETQDNCATGGSGCQNQTQEPADAKPNENRVTNENEHRGPDGASRPVSEQGSHPHARQEDRPNPTVAVDPPAEKETLETQNGNGSQGGVSSPAGVTGGAPTAAGQTESSVVSATEEGGSKQGSETAQPSSSSNNSATGSDVGSGAATPENGTSSAGTEATSNQEGAGNADTDTTTTTTTLPPELTNNKKGDADSSSSISSSVWVRVLLLIVVTLSCILVC